MSKQSGPFLGMFDLQTGPLKQQNCESSGFIFYLWPRRRTRPALMRRLFWWSFTAFANRVR